MRRLRLTRRLFVCHRWLGLVSGLLLIVIALSGSALVFRDGIDGLLFPELHHVDPRGERLPLDRLYEAVRTAHPDAWGLRFRRLHLDDPARSIQMSLNLPAAGGASDWCYLYVDPYEGRILGIQNAEGEGAPWHNPTDWLLWLHFSLLAGRLGEFVVGLLAIAFIGSLVTGLIVYRRQVLAVLLLRIRPRFGRGRLTVSSLHRVVGVWALLFNLLLAVTGFWMIRYVFTPDHFTPWPAADRTPAPALTFSFDEMMDDLRRELPDFRPVWMTPVPREGSVVTLGGALADQAAVFSADSRVRYDLAEQRIVGTDLLSERSLGGHIDAMVHELHYGRYGGWPVQLLYVLGGLTAPLLSVTGFMLWWTRRRQLQRSAGARTVDSQ